MADDLYGYLDDLPAYRQMFYEELPESLEAPVGRPVTGRAGAGVGHLQPRHRRHDGADRISFVAQDLREPRHSSRNAGAGTARRRRRAAPHGVGHLRQSSKHLSPRLGALVAEAPAKISAGLAIGHMSAAESR
jgi:hypothetical protein